MNTLLENTDRHAEALLAPAIEAAQVNGPALDRIADHIAERIRNSGRVFAFGAGHAYAFGAELCSRAGGLPFFTAMSLEDLRDTPRPAHAQLADSEPERIPANGVAIGEQYGLKSGDVLLIASQSGRNGAAVELAEWARARDVYVVAVTSLQHLRAFPSRHPSGRKLDEVADDLLDLRTPSGDAAIETADGRRVGSTSTIAFALLAQLLSARVALALTRAGVDPQVIMSANVDPTATS